MSELSDILSRHARGPFCETAVPGFRIHSADTEGEASGPAYRLLFCGIANGCKRVFLGDQTFDYDPLTYLIASLELPVTARVIQAPYLAFSMELDAEALTAVLLDLPPQAPTSSSAPRAIGVSAVETDLLNVVLRIARLLDRPRDIRVLAPLFMRELLYHLVQGPHGPLLRQLAAPRSHLSQVGAAVQMMRESFDRSLRVATLARVAGMSVPTFHRHFKAATAMSPRQFQKHLRLQEARRLLISNETDAASAAFRVGYESPSQFSRDYRRVFGAPPVQDVKRQLTRFAVVGRNGVKHSA